MNELHRGFLILYYEKRRKNVSQRKSGDKKSLREDNPARTKIQKKTPAEAGVYSRRGFFVPAFSDGAKRVPESRYFP